MKKFWLCFVEGKAGGTKKHEVLAEATKEAKRLARLPDNIERRVFILGCLGYYEAAEIPVTWHLMEDK